MKRLILITACFFFISFQSVAAPALWRIADDDTTIHIFGTIHILKPNTTWANANITNAFAATDALIVELDEKEISRAGPLFKEAGELPLGQSMRALVGNGIYNDVIRVNRQLDLPPAIFENVRPWFASMSLTVISLTKNGFDLSTGADKILIEEALKNRIPILGIETASQQAQMFAGLNAEQDKALLIDALVQSQNVKSEMDRLHAAWLDGDIETLDTILNGGVMKKASLGDHLLYSRNRDWANKLSLLLQKPGSFFMAVGTAHLVGDNSVQSALENMGIQVAREQ
ncbi:MAG: TraB/GumN family protein [Alphaproteobacteria bacterium]|nr:TraB/GumN family protein [Alphaproteobacteria bacterium]